MGAYLVVCENVVHVRVLVDGVHRYGSEPCRCLHIGIWASVSIKGY